MPESLRYYFDFEKYARDAQYSGDITCVELNGSCFVFWNHQTPPQTQEKHNAYL